MRAAGILLVTTIGLTNAGCTLNSVKDLPAGGTPAGNRSVLVYGVKMEGQWRYPGFTTQLAEYDVAKQNITGNCLSFNRTEATLPSAPGTVKYFAFDVPPGHYVYSPFNGAQFEGDFLAFEAPAGKSVYVGDFVFQKNEVVALARNWDGVKSAVDRDLPELKNAISLASTAVAKRPQMFLCTP